MEDRGEPSTAAAEEDEEDGVRKLVLEELGVADVASLSYSPCTLEDGVGEPRDGA
jgi:hypothetical protein